MELPLEDDHDSCRLKTYSSVVQELIAAGRAFYSSHWVLRSGGNFSAVISRNPLQWIITRNGAHMGSLTELDFVQVNEFGQSSDPKRELPPETPLHLSMIAEHDVGAVLHTHSVWSTLLSDLYANAGGLTMEGFEMLKGLPSMRTHPHAEWVPILEDSQDWAILSRKVVNLLTSGREVNGILLRKCGFYTWGKTVDDAIQHVEILEFLFEVLGRRLHILTQLEINAENETCM
jgi:methylthioribulose-1-phosphate dehydratase